MKVLNIKNESFFAPYNFVWYCTTDCTTPANKDAGKINSIM